MNAQEFAYWLQGFFEIVDDHQKGLTEKQTLIIRDHLSLVFNKVTPNRNELKTPTYCAKTPEMKKCSNLDETPSNIIDFEEPVFC